MRPRRASSTITPTSSKCIFAVGADIIARAVVAGDLTLADLRAGAAAGNATAALALDLLRHRRRGGPR